MYLTEIDMTGVLNMYIGKGLTGVVLNGTMYDIGNPSAYRDTMFAFTAGRSYPGLLINANKN
jgi:UTP-glucose-1-phosphate uridylyltransferase